jgi:hypothetical protein
MPAVYWLVLVQPLPWSPVFNQGDGIVEVPCPVAECLGSFEAVLTHKDRCCLRGSPESKARSHPEV